MQIKVSGTQERRGQATRKLMAKVNSLPAPKRSDDSALSDLSFGRSLPFSPRTKKPNKSSSNVDELDIDDDDDEFLKSLASEESETEEKTHLPAKAKKTTTSCPDPSASVRLSERLALRPQRACALN